MTKNNTIQDPYFCLSIWPFDVPRIYVIIFAISQAISSVLTIITNSLLIWALYKTGQLKTISNRLILVMSISDMCMGLIVQPMITIMAAIREKLQDCTLEKLVEYLAFLSGNFSWFVLFCISVDRYFQVTKLNRYSEYMKPMRMRAAVTLSFFIANALAIVIILIPSFILQVTLNIANIMMMTFVASLYMYMIRQLKKQNQNQKAVGIRIPQSHASHLGPVETSKDDGSYISGENCNMAKVRESRKQLSALQTLKMLIIVIFALYGPYNIASTYWTYYKFGKRKNPAVGINIFVLCSYFIVLINASMNACIIIHGNSKMRRFLTLVVRNANFKNSKVEGYCERKTMSQESAVIAARGLKKEI